MKWSDFHIPIDQPPSCWLSLPVCSFLAPREGYGSPKFLTSLFLHATLLDPAGVTGYLPYRILVAGFRGY